MKHSQGFFKLNPTPSSAFENTAELIARILVLQAIRQGGFKKLLTGSPGVIGLVLDKGHDPELFYRATTRLIDIAGFGQYRSLCEVIPFGTARKKRRRSELIDEISACKIVIGIAAAERDFPDDFLLASDGMLKVPALDCRTLKGVLRLVTGTDFSENEVAPYLKIPIAKLGAIIRRWRDADAVRAKLRQCLADTGAKEAQQPESGPSLSDLSGYGEAGEWALMLSEDIKDYRVGKIEWRDVDKGLLLAGPTGTGKTLFASALANTCQMPLFPHSAAKWQACGHLGEMLAAMRKAFAEAHQNSPAILFIDEVDAIGDRSAFLGENKDYSRQVVNALLECIDGFERREGVVVIGATNMPQNLDPALLRPGRLERTIEIPLPDANARVGILGYYLDGKLANGELVDLSSSMEGLTGADIEMWVRSVRRSARMQRRPVGRDDFLSMQPPRRQLTKDEFLRACIHEAGHVIVGLALCGELQAELVGVTASADPPLSAAAAASTQFNRRDTAFRSLKNYMAEATLLLGGIAAELEIYGDFTEGAGGSEASDLYQASGAVGVAELCLGLGSSLIALIPPRADDVAAVLKTNPQARRKVDLTLKECLARARELIASEKSAVIRLAESLMERKRLTSEEVAIIMASANKI
ncbi:AAA+ superfamily predicted ATPase [Phyllobacterium trifolii]|uniref:AAA+ superfamily predicted ATPase n=1 Tax=Phyllobacterium trifolii TaxID=300193 RepID=A0A839UK10_9HYPH|nr:AAA family ATPase [Phyllobacterium trifolii]MBB3149220.1 AAA+ superfamily predicted ATPase [Phyllobacterium trifolii]